MLKKYLLSLFLLLQLCACQLFQDRPANNQVSVPAKPVTFLADEFSIKTSRKLAAENNFKCDLESDRCKGAPLSQSQMGKSLFLADAVAAKLLELERTEKLAGRDFKVALIGRMGSDLTKFQPLKDKNNDGRTLTIDQLIAQMQQTTDAAVVDQHVSSKQISPEVMKENYDRSRKLKYSHLGIAVKNMILKDSNGQIVTRADKGHWAIIHLLYSCEDQKHAYLFRGNLANFLYDHMADYGAEILVPEARMQANMENILLNDYIGKFWLEKQYNAIALSNDLNQQNSNQWVLEVLAASLYPSGQVRDRSQAQAILRETNYHETKVTPTGLYGAMRLPFAAKLISNIMPTVCMQYQPKIQSDGIGEIISALSLEEYLAGINRLAAKYEVELTKDDMQMIEKNFNTKKK